MKYFIIYGDYDYELKVDVIADYIEVLDKLPRYKEDWDIVQIVKGNYMEIITSYVLKEIE